MMLRKDQLYEETDYAPGTIVSSYLRLLLDFRHRFLLGLFFVTIYYTYVMTYSLVSCLIQIRCDEPPSSQPTKILF
jgi:hypothetical protein